MRKFPLLFVIIMILAFTFNPAATAPVYAQGFSTTWSSSFQVQNLGSQEATIQIAYYDQNGGLAPMASGFTNPVVDKVAVGASNTYFPVHAAAGFNGSVVISSSQRIAVISNVFANTPAQAVGSYVGFEAGGPNLYFPLIMKGNNNQTSTFSVQNTGGSAAAITIQFIPEAGSSYPSIPNITDNLPVSAAHTYNLSTLSQFNGISKWVGSVKVSVQDPANDSIAGVANNVKTTLANAYELSTYNGFVGSGSTEVVLPLIQESNANNRTAISCQNVGSSPTNITVKYTPEAGSVNKPQETKTNVPPNGLAVFLQLPSGTGKFVGSAVATSSGQPMFCVVSQQKMGTGRASLYEGFAKSKVSPKLIMPLIQSKNGNPTNGWVYTALTIATVDGSSHPIRCTFKPAPGIGTPPPQSATGASIVLVQQNLFGNGTKFVGGAECTTTDGSNVGLFGIVNMLREAPPQSPRDVQSTYDAFNQ